MWRASKCAGFAFVLALTVASGACADADGSNCQLTMFSKLPLNFDLGGRVNTPVTINGQAVNMLIDTGAPFSVVNQTTASLPGMRIFGSGRLQIELYGGYKSHAIIMVQNSAFGDMRPGFHPFFVVPDALTPGVSGLLGADVLRNFDIEFDFADSQLDIFSQDHCPGRVVYWTRNPYARVPFTMDQANHIRLPVQLGGGVTLAMINTGAQNTVGSFEDITEGLHIDPKDPALKPILDQQGHVWGYRYPFKTLTFEGVTVNNPDIILVPNKISKFPADQRQLIIGMNILRHLRMYIAYGEQALYLTGAAAH